MDSARAARAAQRAAGRERRCEEIRRARERECVESARAVRAKKRALGRDAVEGRGVKQRTLPGAGQGGSLHS